MIVRWLPIVLLILVLVNKSRSECLCTQQGQEVICNENVVQNQDTSVGIDQMLLSKTALPFQHIKILRMHCNVKTLSANWFANQNSLRELDLSLNKITRIPNDAFNSLLYLEILNISNNQLRNPSRNAFNNVKNIKVLDLSFNRISSIDRQVLDKMPQLEKFYVSNNGLFELPPETFEETIRIKEVDVSHNHIRSIDKLLFKYNPDLESLNFAKNDIYEMLSSETFGYTKKLKYLNLSSSSIVPVPEMFITNMELITLDLSKNSLQKLPQNIFNPLINLETLSLAYCQLLNLPSDILNQNQKLQDLNLSGNNLRQFPPQFFDLRQNLKILNISKNLFRSIPSNIFHKTALVTLDISSNLLSVVTPDLLNIPTLENVYLQNNKLTQLNALSKSQFPLPIKYLHLEFNQIVFLKPELFDVLTLLKKIEILNNPWNCKCFEELLEILSKKNVDYEVGHYREGDMPLCVASDICNYDETNLSYYYDIYKKRF